MLGPHIDAYRVDVKGFSDAQYKELCRIPDMGPVLTAAELAKTDYGCHVEIVTNVIPTFNDDEATLRGIADWIVDSLGPATPWHVTRFMPYLEFAHLPPTPIPTLEDAVRIGHDGGPRVRLPRATCRGTKGRTPSARTVNDSSSGGPATRLRMWRCGEHSVRCVGERERPHLSQEVTVAVNVTHWDLGLAAPESIGFTGRG